MKTTKPLLMVITVIFTILLSSYLSFAETEPNDVQALANAMPLNGSENGSLGSGSPIDVADWFYTITNQNGDISITLNITGGTLVGNVGFFSKAGGYFGGSGNTSTTASFTYNCFAADTIYIRVLRSTGNGTYTINNSLSPPTYSNDAEPNDVRATANFISLNTINSGQLGYFDVDDGTESTDYYFLETGFDGNVTATIILDGTLTGNVGFYAKNGSFLGGSGNSNDTTSFTSNCRSADTIFVRVSRAAGCGSYLLNVTLDSVVVPNDPEPNDVLSQGSEVLLNQPNVGHLGYLDVDDGVDGTDYYFLVTNFDGNVIATAIFGGSLSGNVGFFAKNGGFLGGSGNTADTATFTSQCRSADTIFVRINRANGCGDYTFYIELDSVSVPNDPEPNNTFVLGSEILLNSDYQGHLGYTDIDDGTDAIDNYFLVTHFDGNVVGSVIFGGTLTGNIGMYGKNSGYLGGSPNSDTVSFTAICRSADTIFVRVNRAGGCGPYTLHVTLDSSGAPNDLEPNNLFAEANTTLSENVSVTGHLGYTDVDDGTDASDYYKIVTDNDGNTTVNVLFEGTLSGNVAMYRKNSGFIGNSPNTSGIASYTASCYAADTLIVRVVRAGGCGSYKLEYELTPPPFINDVEPNNSIAEALLLEPGKVKYGHLGYTDVDIALDANDYYKFNIPNAPVTVTIDVTLDSSMTGNLALFNPAGGFVANTPNGTGKISITYTYPSAGMYSLRVLRASGCGSYFIGLPCKNPPTNLNVSEITASAALLDWNPTSGAIQYSIRGAPIGSSPSELIQVKRPMGTGTSFKTLRLDAGTTYFWQARAHCSLDNTLQTGWSGADTFSTLPCSPTTADSTTNVSNSSATLHWTTNPLISYGYEIIGQTASGGPLQSLKINDPDIGSKTIINLKSGTSYVWGVKVICNNKGDTRSAISNIQMFTTGGVAPKIASSIEPDIIPAWMVYPNPVNEVVTISLGKDIDITNTTLRIHDLQGKVMLVNNVDQLNMSIDVSELHNGVYLVSLNTNDNRNFVKRLMIAK